MTTLRTDMDALVKLQKRALDDYSFGLADALEDAMTAHRFKAHAKAALERYEAGEIEGDGLANHIRSLLGE